MAINGNLPYYDMASNLKYARDPLWLKREDMQKRLGRTHWRDEMELPACVETAEEVEGLAVDIRHHEDNGWTFDGIYGGGSGAYLSFYRMLPWTPEQIQEAKDWLEANPFVIKEDKDESI